MNVEGMVQQYIVFLQRLELEVIIMSLFMIGIQAGLIYLMFGKVLIPITRALCNFLNAKAGYIDPQRKDRYAAPPDLTLKPWDEFMPKP
jgi:hypothetical protein